VEYPRGGKEGKGEEIERGTLGATISWGGILKENEKLHLPKLAPRKGQLTGQKQQKGRN